MERRTVETIARALDQATVRYLIVGGLAVVAHGVVRFTADMDVVLDPDPAVLRRAIGVLAAMGYRPRAPVALEDFADAASRVRWAREKGMTVFSLFSPEHPATEVDLFLEPPFDFMEAHARALRVEVSPGNMLTFISRRELIDMKRATGRRQDLADASALEELLGEDKSNG